MKKVLLLNILFVLGMSPFASGQIPQTISYQGVLTNASGNAVDGNRSLTFRLYEQAESGTPIWEETQDVVVATGLFNVILGSSSPLNLPFDMQYWLGIAVGQDAEITPRIALTASPYSLNTLGGGVSTGDGHSLNAVDGDPTDVVFVDTEGKVGVGTTAPQATLHVTGTGATPIFQVSMGAAGTAKPGLAAERQQPVARMILDETGLEILGEEFPLALFSIIVSGSNAVAPDLLLVKAFDPIEEVLFGISRDGSVRTAGSFTVGEENNPILSVKPDDRLVLIGGESDPFIIADPSVKRFQVGPTTDFWLRADSGPDAAFSLWQGDQELYNMNPSEAFIIPGLTLEGGLTLNGGILQFPDGTTQSTAAGGGGINIPGNPGEGIFLDASGSPAGNSNFIFVDDPVPGNRRMNFSVGARFDDANANEVAAINEVDAQGLRRSIFAQAEAPNMAAEFDGPVHMVNGEVALWESTFRLELNPSPGGSVQGTTASIPEMLAVHALRKADGVAADQATAAAIINRRDTGDAIFAAVNNPNNFSAAVTGFSFGPGPAINGTVTDPTSLAAALFGATSGIGPALEVNQQGPSGDIAVFKSDFANQARIDKTGKGFFNGGTQTGGADMAEAFEVEGFVDTYEPGDVIAISTDNDRTVEKSLEPYSPLVIGVYATKPGVLLSERHIDANQDDTIPVGVVGVIPTKVSGENGPIHRGDLLVASSTPGHAMKGTNRDRMFGSTIGKALQEFAGTGTGVIRVLVNVQ